MRSLTPNAQSTQMDPQMFTVRLNTHKLPTTQVMVDEAITTLNSARGFSLQKLKKYINEKYQIEITTRRYALIKDYLHLHLTNGKLSNVTGRGLSGCLKLKAKEKQKNSSSIISKVHNLTNSVHQSTVAGRKGKTTKSKSKNVTASAPPTTTPDTPTNQKHKLAVVPNAPQRNSMATAEHHSQVGLVQQQQTTPCSSGGRKVSGRRRMLRPIESSQVF